MFAAKMFKGPYLRVIKPVTINGIIPATDQSGRVRTEETFLPLTARKHIEKENAALVKSGNPHLVMKIETVGL